MNGYYYGYPSYNGAGGAMNDALGQYKAPYVPQMAHAQNNGAIQWVQGESGAKSYYVAPGQTALLMDSETQTFFIKTADASGMPMPLRVFEYQERTGANLAQISATEAKTTEYVTRTEFDEIRAKIDALLGGGVDTTKEENTNG